MVTSVIQKIRRDYDRTTENWISRANLSQLRAVIKHLRAVLCQQNFKWVSLIAIRNTAGHIDLSGTIVHVRWSSVSVSFRVVDYDIHTVSYQWGILLREGFEFYRRSIAHVATWKNCCTNITCMPTPISNTYLTESINSILIYKNKMSYSIKHATHNCGDGVHISGEISRVWAFCTCMCGARGKIWEGFQLGQKCIRR